MYIEECYERYIEYITNNENKLIPLYIHENEFIKNEVRGFSENLYQFVYEKCKIDYDVQKYNIEIAAVTINKEGSITLYINPLFFSFMFNEMIKEIGLDEVVQNIIGVLYHEMMHVLLRHFRKSNYYYSNNMLANIAMDIIVDNMVKKDIPQWRDWSNLLSQINLSPNKEDKNYVLKYTEEDIYVLLENLQTPIDENLTDTHLWDEFLSDENGKESDNKEGGEEEKEEGKGTQRKDDSSDNSRSGKTDGNKEYEGYENNGDEYETVEYGQGDKYEDFDFPYVDYRETSKRPDKTIGSIIKSYGYSYLNLLRKYLVRISYKSRKTTWKKYNKKLPGLLPGSKSVRKPGTIVVAVDVSGSMQLWLNLHLQKFMSDIYGAFSYIARYYSMPSKLVFSQISDVINKFEEVENIDEFFNNFSFYGGGGTDYKPLFDYIIDNWKKTEPTQRIPDLLIVVTDEEFDDSFLINPRYSVFKNHLVWITTVPIETESREFPVGEKIFFNKLSR